MINCYRMSKSALMSEEANKNYGATTPTRGAGGNVRIDFSNPGGSSNNGRNPVDSLGNFTQLCENITSNIFAIGKHGMLSSTLLFIKKSEM